MAEWYILKGENKFGPFSYPDVLKMLQQKVVFEFDFAWHPGLSTWVRIADLDSFKPDNIGKMKETLMPEISEVFSAAGTDEFAMAEQFSFTTTSRSGKARA